MLEILRGQFITPAGLETLKRYKYKSSEYTILDAKL